MRLIDADALDYSWIVFAEELINKIKKAPTIEAEPVVHGKWIETKNGFHCSNCKRKPGQHPTKRGVFLSDFCPNCGAKMDGDQNGA